MTTEQALDMILKHAVQGAYDGTTARAQFLEILDHMATHGPAIRQALALVKAMKYLVIADDLSAENEADIGDLISTAPDTLRHFVLWARKTGVE